MRNYAGHRLAPWLAHVMVSRQETARALLTPGEVMQLPPRDELVLVAGLAPIRAQKLRYYEDANFVSRLAAPPRLTGVRYADCPPPRGDDWRGCLAAPVEGDVAAARDGSDGVDEGGAQQARAPELGDVAARSVPLPHRTDPLSFGDTADPAADKRILDLASAPRPLPPVLVGHAIDEAASRRGEPELGL